MDDLNFTLTDYIGSAYNPQVSITVTDEGHVVSITYMSPSGLDTVSYTVPDWSDEEQARADAEAQRLQAEADRVIAENNRAAAEQARVAAESARVAAEQGRMDAEASRVAAEQARVAAEQSRVNAETAREQASQTAVANANAAAAAANTAASNADDKAQAAQAAAVDASSAASAAASAATYAATAAADANTAAASAADAAGAAGTAASAATSAASEATDAADSANAAADRADAAAESIEDELAQKADKDGYYSQMTVGLAENLVGRGDSMGAEYLYRTAGGTQSIEDGDAEVTEIRGNTLKWNQYAKEIQRGNQWYAGTSSQITYGDDYATITPIRATGFTFCSIVYHSNIPTSVGHKYLVSYDFKCDDWSDVTATNKAFPSFCGFWFNTGSAIPDYTSTEWQHIDFIAEVAAGASQNVEFSMRRCGEVNPFYLKKKPNFIDLTLAYGAGNEPTVEQFRREYPNDYDFAGTPYLLPVNMEGIETVGFNQWDEEWEVGGYANANGAKWTTSDRIRSKNAIPVFPNTVYHIEAVDHAATVNGLFNIYFYNADGGYVGNTTKANYHDKTGGDFTTPANARQMRFATQPDYGTTYDHDICINLSWSGYRNGEYEPYWDFQRAIDTSQWFPNGMHAIGDVHDSLTEDAAIHRIGVVDLGTLTWRALGTNTTGLYRMRAPLPTIKIVPNTQVGNLSCVNYEATTANSTWQAIEGMSSETNSEISIYDPNYNTQESVAAFKEAMSGVILLYELATPTTEEIDPPLNLTYKVSDFGTERIMVDETAQAPQSAPVPMSVVYAANASDTVRRLPVDYISEKSFENFRSALASALGLTITEEFDTDQGKYVYTVEQTQTTEGE